MRAGYLLRSDETKQVGEKTWNALSPSACQVSSGSMNFVPPIFVSPNRRRMEVAIRRGVVTTTWTCTQKGTYTTTRSKMFIGHVLGRVPKGDISRKVDQKCIYNDSCKDKCFHKGQVLGLVPIRNDV